MKLDIDREWLLRMAEKEGNCIVSVGGLVARIEKGEPMTREEHMAWAKQRALAYCEPGQEFGPGIRASLDVDGF